MNISRSRMIWKKYEQKLKKQIKTNRIFPFDSSSYFGSLPVVANG